MKTEKHDQTTTEYSTQGPQVLKSNKTGDLLCNTDGIKHKSNAPTTRTKALCVS